MKIFLQITWCTGFLNVFVTFYRLQEGAREADPNTTSSARPAGQMDGQTDSQARVKTLPWLGAVVALRLPPFPRTQLRAASSQGLLKCSQMHSRAEIFPCVPMGQSYFSGFLPLESFLSMGSLWFTLNPTTKKRFSILHRNLKLIAPSFTSILMNPAVNKRICEFSHLFIFMFIIGFGKTSGWREGQSINLHSALYLYATGSYNLQRICAMMHGALLVDVWFFGDFSFRYYPVQTKAVFSDNL